SPRPRWCEPNLPNAAAGALRRRDPPPRAPGARLAPPPRRRGQGRPEPPRRAAGPRQPTATGWAAGLAAWRERRREPVAAAADRGAARAAAQAQPAWHVGHGHLGPGAGPAPAPGRDTPVRAGGQPRRGRAVPGPLAAGRRVLRRERALAEPDPRRGGP